MNVSALAVLETGPGREPGLSLVNLKVKRPLIDSQNLRVYNKSQRLIYQEAPMDTLKKEKRSPLKDKPLRLPGQSLDVEIHRLQLEIFTFVGLALVLMLVAYSEWVSWYFHAPPAPLVFFILALIFTLYAFFKVYQTRKTIKNIKLGRDGERTVAESLEELKRKGATVFHDIMGKDFNVDHVLVSPQGVFVVETKTYSKPRGNPSITSDGDKIMVPGKQPDYKPIQQAIANADWIRKELRELTGKVFQVTPVVVFPGWWVDEKIDGRRIWVLNPKGLASRISKEPISLSTEDMHLIAYDLSRLNRILE